MKSDQLWPAGAMHVSMIINSAHGWECWLRLGKFAVARENWNQTLLENPPLSLEISHLAMLDINIVVSTRNPQEGPFSTDMFTYIHKWPVQFWVHI